MFLSLVSPSESSIYQVDSISPMSCPALVDLAVHGDPNDTEVAPYQLKGERNPSFCRASTVSLLFSSHKSSILDDSPPRAALTPFANALKGAVPGIIGSSSKPEFRVATGVGSDAP